jgi:hypothetical protein
MLLNLSKKTWTEGLLLHNFTNHAASNEKVRHSSWMHTTFCVQQFKQHPCTHLLRAKVFSVFLPTAFARPQPALIILCSIALPMPLCMLCPTAGCLSAHVGCCTHSPSLHS